MVPHEIKTRMIADDDARLRSAALELLAAIHEKMVGVTEQEVLAILDTDKKSSATGAKRRRLTPPPA